MSEPRIRAGPSRRFVRREVMEERVDDENTTAEDLETTEPMTVSEEIEVRPVETVVTAEVDSDRVSAVSLIARIVGFVFLLVYLLLGVRLVLGMLAARPDAEFTRWVTVLSESLYQPFQGLLPTLVSEGGFRLELSLLFAIAIYAIVHYAIVKLLALFAYRRATV